jgi:hypothetical protein
MSVISESYKYRSWDLPDNFKEAIDWLHKNPKFNKPIIIPWSTNYETFMWTNDKGICVDTCNNQNWYNYIDYNYVGDDAWSDPEFNKDNDKEYFDLSTLKDIYRKDFKSLWERKNNG